jgi:AcrR family transcriptional regulator
MSRFASRGERTRSEIIEAAYRLFEQQGYHGTSMRQIAQQAGIALGGIYNHFTGKEEIFEQVLETYHPYHEIVPIVKNAQGVTVEAFVRNAAEGIVTVLDRRPDFLNLLLIEIVEFKSKHLPRLIERFFPEVMSIVGEFAEMKNLRSIPLAIIVRTFLGNFYAYYLIEKFIGEAFPEEVREHALDHSIDIFLHGIVSQG